MGSESESTKVRSGLTFFAGSRTSAPRTAAVPFVLTFRSNRRRPIPGRGERKGKDKRARSERGAAN